MIKIVKYKSNVKLDHPMYKNDKQKVLIKKLNYIFEYLSNVDRGYIINKKMLQGKQRQLKGRMNFLLITLLLLSSTMVVKSESVGGNKMDATKVWPHGKSINQESVKSRIESAGIIGERNSDIKDNETQQGQMKPVLYMNSRLLTTACNIDNCKLCDADASPSPVCTQCDFGFYIDFSNGQICGNCQTSADVTQHCSQCYYQSGSLNPPLPVVIVCTECLFGYTLDATGTCVPCTTADTNCDTCIFSGDTPILQCSNCIGNNFVNTQFKCTTCNVANCFDCKDGVDAVSPQCDDCSPNYILTSTSTCEACAIQNCLDCDYNSDSTPVKVCTLCKTGFYIKSDGSCDACGNTLQNCDECQGTGYCTKCSAGYVPNPADNKCELCNKDLVPLGDCQTCTSDGYYDTCQTCTTQKKLPDVNGHCQLCADAATINLPNCEQCEQVGNTKQPRCKLCKDGYILNSAYLCVTCDQALTLTNQNSCDKCVNQKKQADGSPDDSGVQCILCKTENFFPTYNYKNCLVCGEIINNCGLTKCVFLIATGTLKPKTYCTECINSQYPTKNNLDCVNCNEEIPNCKTCPPINFVAFPANTQCSECNANAALTLDHQTCSECSRSAPNCETCEYITSPANVVFCKKCNINNIPTIDRRRCVLCNTRVSSLCKTCDNPTPSTSVCLSCNPSGLVPNYPHPNKKSCVICQAALSRCIRCQVTQVTSGNPRDVLTNCKQCQSGFELKTTQTGQIVCSLKVPSG